MTHTSLPDTSSDSLHRVQLDAQAADSCEASLLSLPQPLLVGILDSAAEAGSEHLASAMLACKALRQAGEAVPHKARLVLTSAKLQRARKAGHERQLMAWLSSKAQMWQQVVVQMVSQTDLRLLLVSLAAAGNGHLRKLQLDFVEEDDFEGGSEAELPGAEVCYRLPQVDSWLVSLKRPKDFLC